MHVHDMAYIHTNLQSSQCVFVFWIKLQQELIYLGGSEWVLRKVSKARDTAYSIMVRSLTECCPEVYILHKSACVQALPSSLHAPYGGASGIAVLPLYT